MINRLKKNKIIINIRYIYFLIRYCLMKKNKLNILNDEDSIDEIINKRKSICRYGDGEFKWLLNIKQNSFQSQNKLLQEKLEEVLQDTDNQNMIIGIPIMFNSLKDYNYDAKNYWMPFLVKNYKKIYKHLNKDYTYCNASFTRPYIDFKDKSSSVMDRKFSLLRKIWDNKNIIIVEGEFSRLGIDNDLFDNSNSIKRIICPSTNAFDKYDEIKEAITKLEKDNLILLSLGPTATVLASDLSKIGYQAIDIGHIDIEYMWYLNKCTKKVPIKGRLVNEARTSDKSHLNINNKNYEKQIINKIKD